MCLRLASKGAFNLAPGRGGAVISSRRLPSLNIGSFTGGDKGALINRRLGDRGENTFVPFFRFLLVWRGSPDPRIPGSPSQESGLPNSSGGFIKDLQTSCSRKRPPAHSKSHRAFNTRISAGRVAPNLFTCARSHVRRTLSPPTKHSFLASSRLVKKKNSDASSPAAAKPTRAEGNRSSNKVTHL